MWKYAGKNGVGGNNVFGEIYIVLNFMLTYFTIGLIRRFFNH